LEIFLKSGFKMKNKKAILLPETLKIILAVIGISLLLYLSVNLYGLFTTKTDIEQARSSLEKLYSGIEKVENNEEVISEVFLESPNGWWVIAWPYEKEDKKPLQCKSNCICLCPTAKGKENSLKECSNLGFCKDVSKKVITIYEPPTKNIEEEISGLIVGWIIGNKMPILIEGPTSLKIELDDKGTEDEKIIIRSN